MIKYFKIFETVNQGEPEVGDFVICKKRNKIPTLNLDPNFNDFISSNIGKIISFDELNGYSVHFDDVPYEIRYNFGFWQPLYRTGRILTFNLLYWSKNREDLLPFIQANKFGL